MSDIGRRIKEAAENVGGMNKLAEITGIPRRTLGDHVSGATEPKASALAAIAGATKVDLNWLVLNEPRAVSIGGNLVTLPRYEVRASAGNGALVLSESVTDYMAISRDWLRRNLPSWAPPNAIVGALEGGGDSMEPTIHDGDLIVVVRNPPWYAVEYGGIFVLTVDHDRLLLKRLQVMMNGDLAIISDNPAYVTETIPRDEVQDRVIVHGQVFFAGGKPRSFVRR